MKKIYSKTQPDTLLHIIHRKEDFESEREDLVDPTQFIQLSTLKLDEGKTFKPHAHVWKRNHKKAIAQESWVVVRGKVKCFFYDLDDKLVATEELKAGDCSITLFGGHTYEILKDGTLVYEFKTGPYLGQEHDKRFLNE